tara:strand:- start:696 stop:932 length:237 start_codon:yes stop_codon:yes gene_type:complete
MKKKTMSKRFVFIFKPSNIGIPIVESKAVWLIKEGHIKPLKEKCYKAKDCVYLYAEDPDFNYLKVQHGLLTIKPLNNV